MNVTQKSILSITGQTFPAPKNKPLPAGWMIEERRHGKECCHQFGENVDSFSEAFASLGVV